MTVVIGLLLVCDMLFIDVHWFGCASKPIIINVSGVFPPINPKYFDVHQGYKVLTQSHFTKCMLFSLSSFRTLLKSSGAPRLGSSAQGDSADRVIGIGELDGTSLKQHWVYRYTGYTMLEMDDLVEFGWSIWILAVHKSFGTETLHRTWRELFRKRQGSCLIFKTS